MLNGVILAANSTEKPAFRFIIFSTFVYGLFLWTSYEFIYVPRVMPDALVMAASLAAAAFCYGIGENPGDH